MSVASTSAVSAATSSTTQTNKTQSGTGTQTLGYDAFLKLFIAELKNQDPTNPPDSSAFVAQLANFSNVEQAVKTNAKLDALMALSALSQANSLIGRTVTSADGLTSGKVMSLRAESGGAIAVLTNGEEVTLGEGVSVT
jgi:flagellar basal-body rod modification protein FlgD